MIGELVYTSAPRGLDPNATGFCTVAATRGLSVRERRLLESLSGYSFAYGLSDAHAASNPTTFAHYRLELGGARRHVLSRVAFAGADHTGRTNKIAHHLLLDPGSLPEPGPAAALLELEDASWLFTQWEGPPRELEPRSLPSLSAPELDPATGWERYGDAGWAGALARAQRELSGAVNLTYAASSELLPLFAASERILAPAERWGVTFSTYFTGGLPPGVTCSWRGLLNDTKTAGPLARKGGALTLDLTRPLPTPDEDEFTRAARAGRSLPIAVELRRPVRAGLAKAPPAKVTKAPEREELRLSLSPAPATIASVNAPLWTPSARPRGSKLKSPWILAAGVALLAPVVWFFAQRSAPPPRVVAVKPPSRAPRPRPRDQRLDVKPPTSVPPRPRPVVAPPRPSPSPSRVAPEPRVTPSAGPSPEAPAPPQQQHLIATHFQGPRTKPLAPDRRITPTTRAADRVEWRLPPGDWREVVSRAAPYVQLKTARSSPSSVELKLFGSVRSAGTLSLFRYSQPSAETRLVLTFARAALVGSLERRALEHLGFEIRGSGKANVVCTLAQPRARDVAAFELGPEDARKRGLRVFARLRIELPPTLQPFVSGSEKPARLPLRLVVAQPKSVGALATIKIERHLELNTLEAELEIALTPPSDSAGLKNRKLRRLLDAHQQRLRRLRDWAARVRHTVTRALGHVPWVSAFAPRKHSTSGSKASSPGTLTKLERALAVRDFTLALRGHALTRGSQFWVLDPWGVPVASGTFAWIDAPLGKTLAFFPSPWRRK